MPNTPTPIQAQTRLLITLSKLQETAESLGAENSLQRKGELKKFRSRLVALLAMVDTCLETQERLTVIAKTGTEFLTWQWGEPDDFDSWNDRSHYIKAKTASEAITKGLRICPDEYEIGDVVSARPVALSDFEVQEEEVEEDDEDSNA